MPACYAQFWSLNTVRGGLGLTGGLADVGGLAECLEGIHDGKASFDILDKYDEIRRGVFNDIVSPVSTTNLQRLWKDPEDALENDEFFKLLERAKTEPEIAEGLQLVRLSFSQWLCCR